MRGQKHRDVNHESFRKLSVVPCGGQMTTQWDREERDEKLQGTQGPDHTQGPMKNEDLAV